MNTVTTKTDISSKYVGILERFQESIACNVVHLAARTRCNKDVVSCIKYLCDDIYFVADILLNLSQPDMYELYQKHTFAAMPDEESIKRLIELSRNLATLDNEDFSGEEYETEGLVQDVYLLYRMIGDRFSLFMSTYQLSKKDINDILHDVLDNWSYTRHFGFKLKFRW